MFEKEVTRDSTRGGGRGSHPAHLSLAPPLGRVFSFQNSMELVVGVPLLGMTGGIILEKS